MKIKDKNHLLKKTSRNYFIHKMIDLEALIKCLGDELEILEAEVIKVENGYDLEISLKDKLIESRIYKITIDNNADLIYIERNDKKYIDTYKITNQEFLIHQRSRIFKNSKKNEKIEEKYLSKEKPYETIEYDNELYRIYNYKYKNQYLNADITISMPDNYPFTNSLFIKNIFDSLIVINDTETLFYFVKKALNNKKIAIKIINNQDLIIFNNNELIEYSVFKNNQKIEYKKGYDKLLITKYEEDTFENKKFQKFLKNIRS